MWEAGSPLEGEGEQVVGNLAMTGHHPTIDVLIQCEEHP